MKRLCALVLPAVSLLVAAPSPKPKLVLGVAIDQFRYDYLLRFGGEYKGGLARLLTKGAVFTNAQYEHFPTVTAIGHSTFMSGATPALSGIVGNDWYDRESGKVVTSVSDDSVKILGGKGEGGASPKRLLVSTIGDELKIASGGKCRVIGISLKDRSAILPSGHMADAAYWFDRKSGSFVTSTFYFSELPAWVRDFNAGRPADKYASAKWTSIDGSKVFKQMAAAPGEKFYDSLAATPFANELIEQFAERAIAGEQLGRHEAPDLLTVSFSANDYVGHELGPDAPEVRDMSIRTDRLLEKFFSYIEGQIGPGNVLIVLTADHGVAPLPEVSQKRKMPGGRMPEGIIQDTVQARLAAKYGPGNWIARRSEYALYFNRDLIRQKNLNAADVERTGAEAALAVPHVFRVYTNHDLATGNVLPDQVGRRVMNGFYQQRAADVTVLLEPYWLFGAHGTSHGTAFMYDVHVPLIFLGPGIRAGNYEERVAPNDIAPTLATLLSIETPSSSVGRVLREMLDSSK